MSCRMTIVIGLVASMSLAAIAPAVSRAADQRARKQAKKVSPPTMDLTGIAESGNRFAWELYGQLRQSEGNLFLSPSSIVMALAMTYAGAEGATQEEMARTLHFQLPKPQLADAMQALLAQGKPGDNDKKQGYRLRVANRLWGQNSYDFLPAFLDTTRINYGAELARLDFAQATEAARKTINLWVEEQTENKITDLIPPGALAEDTKLVLTNAVYFKGDWTKPFDKTSTKDEDFKLAAGRTVKTPLMHRAGKLPYAAADGLQVLALPYGDGSLSMIVLLPDEVTGLADLEAKLSYDNFRQWTAGLKAQEVLVYLPKFKTTASFELNGALRELGMPSAFDAASADFSGMTGGKDLFISRVVHKAFVDVNEEGTEAAAATGVLMAPTAMPVQKPKPIFRADHPFVFLIRDDRNGAILFLGRLTDPSQ